MTEAQILDLSLKAMLLVLILSMPTILITTMVGLLVSLFQALTQIQEQTLGFAVKLIASTIALVATISWMGAELFNYTANILDSIGGIK